MSKAEKLLKKTRGATMVEYALLILVIMVLAAAAFRTLGGKVKQGATDSAGELHK